MNTICNLSPRCGWFSEREQRRKNDRVVLYSACLTWRLVMSPRSREGHFLLLREGIYLPAPPLHLDTGHDLHKRYLSVSLRWWNTISSQRVPHRSAGVRGGKQRTSLQECQRRDWLRSAGLTEGQKYFWHGAAVTWRRVRSFNLQAHFMYESCSLICSSSLQFIGQFLFFFIRTTFETHPHWWLPKVSYVTIVPPIVTAADWRNHFLQF